MTTKPIILKEGSYTIDELEKFKIKNKIWKVKDLLAIQLTEFFEISHPSKMHSLDVTQLQEKYIHKINSQKLLTSGNWVYFPWNGYFIHILEEGRYLSLLTNRNKFLITEEEQQVLLNTCIAFVGLSVGSHFAAGLVHNGIAKTIKLADFDKLSTTNLNRMRYGVKDIGDLKINLIAQEIYEVNPYIQLELYNKGIHTTDLKNLLEGKTIPSIIFEMIDDFKMKVQLRIAAREKRIPLIMFTHLEDNLMIDIERYDLYPDLPLFNGLLGDVPEKILNSNISEKDKIKFAIQIVNPDNLPYRLLESLGEINKKLVGRPQLYSTVAIGGGFASYLTRKILLDQSDINGRFYISFNSLLKLKDKNYDLMKTNIINKLHKSVGI